jgi:hypothetical protein
MAAGKSSRPARNVIKLTDLAPRQDIKGGSQRRVFGADPIRDDRKAGSNESAATGRPARDLPSK